MAIKQVSLKLYCSTCLRIAAISLICFAWLPISQSARSTALQQFRDGVVNVLVATDVAARGLDVQGVELVVNYSLGMTIDMYVHRIGRCGRAGRCGTAHTFVIDEDRHLVPALIQLLERNRQLIPSDLRDLAQKASVHNKTNLEDR